MPGWVGKTSSPAGTVETKTRLRRGCNEAGAIFNRPCGTRLQYRQTPAFKRRAILKMSLWDMVFSNGTKTEMRPVRNQINHWHLARGSDIQTVRFLFGRLKI
jgi:hypothetical protein